MHGGEPKEGGGAHQDQLSPPTNCSTGCRHAPGEKCGLDGLQNLLRRRFTGQSVYLVRYADDFIITGTAKAVLVDEVKPLVSKFFKERGLELAE